MRRARGLLLLLVLASCAARPAAVSAPAEPQATCAGAAFRLTVLSLMMEQVTPDEAAAERLAAAEPPDPAGEGRVAIERRCQEELWSEERRRCVVAARSHDESLACR